MEPEADKPPGLRPLEHRIWTLVFRLSALVLVVSMVAIAGFPNSVGYSWVYWVGLASALSCAGAAAVLRKLESEAAADDAVWVLRFRERGTSQKWDLDSDD